MKILQVGRRTDEDVADLHQGLEVESFSVFWLSDKADIDLSGIEHVECLVGGLALDGNVHVWIFSDESF